MKTVDISPSGPPLAELLAAAAKENVLIRTAQGRHFLLAEVDDFESEVALLRESEKFMAFLDERSKMRATIPLADLRKELEASK